MGGMGGMGGIGGFGGGIVGGFGGGGFGGGGGGGGGIGIRVPPGGRGKPGMASAPKPQPGGRPAGGAAGQPPGGGEVNRQDAERYGVYQENEFRSPHAAPLSTFSADVNTASYSNVRRFLLGSNQLPPKDAVFLAEFVNYFPYAYTKPKGDDPVAFALEMGPCPWNRQHHLVRVGVQARQLDPAQMPPRNLVFLIDTSGSMDQPNRLPLVKQSLGLLIDRLTAKDTVSIVTYAGVAGVALGPTNGAEREKIRGVVNRLGANGSTNGEGGLKAAYDMATRTFIEGGVNRVILCTDGDFNVGQTSQGELVRMIEEKRRSRVFLTILGYEMGDYKDDMLKELANHGNGHHAYIDSLDEARKVFVEQGGALACVAKDVKFQVEFNPAKVATYRLLGYENRLLKDEDFKNDAKDAGDLGSGHQVTVLYELVPVGVPVNPLPVDPLKYQAPKATTAAAADEWLTVKMRYKHPEEETSKELSQALPTAALGKDLSADFRFAAAAASLAMLLRDSQYKGAMTHAGVLEEAGKCLRPDPNGHRKEFLALVKRANDLTLKPKIAGPAQDGN
ncbi:MAG: hypothetical protein JWO38_3476 [Gemmataceae bacterium]|nr:hypothetical protein [Gemmataceae bacterium]